MHRSRWQQHAGEYRAPLGGNQISVLVTNEGLSLRLKLNLNRQSVRLTEFRPNLFLTPDGRSVVFRDGAMDFSGLSFVRDRLH